MPLKTIAAPGIRCFRQNGNDARAKPTRSFTDWK